MLRMFKSRGQLLAMLLTVALVAISEPAIGQNGPPADTPERFVLFAKDATATGQPTGWDADLILDGIRHQEAGAEVNLANCLFPQYVELAPYGATVVRDFGELLCPAGDAFGLFTLPAGTKAEAGTLARYRGASGTQSTYFPAIDTADVLSPSDPERQLRAGTIVNGPVIHRQTREDVTDGETTHLALFVPDNVATAVEVTIYGGTGRPASRGEVVTILPGCGDGPADGSCNPLGPFVLYRLEAKTTAGSVRLAYAEGAPRSRVAGWAIVGADDGARAPRAIPFRTASCEPLYVKRPDGCTDIVYPCRGVIGVACS